MRTHLVNAYVDLFFVRVNPIICDNYPDVEDILDKISDALLDEMTADEVYMASALRDTRLEAQAQ